MLAPNMDLCMYLSYPYPFKQEKMKRLFRNPNRNSQAIT